MGIIEFITHQKNKMVQQKKSIWMAEIEKEVEEKFMKVDYKLELSDTLKFRNEEKKELFKLCTAKMTEEELKKNKDVEYDSFLSNKKMTLEEKAIESVKEQFSEQLANLSEAKWNLEVFTRDEAEARERYAARMRQVLPEIVNKHNTKKA